MKLSRTVAYAIRATLQLAQGEPETPMPCSRLASEGQMPERFLLQVLRNLVHHGVLHSTRGVDGGYSLHRPLQEISLLEVIEAVDGPLTSRVPPNPGLNDQQVELLTDKLKEINDLTRNQLEAIKLSALATRGPGRKPETGGG